MDNDHGEESFLPNEEKKKTEAITAISREFAFKNQCISDFKNNVAMMKWLDNYCGASHENFINDYAENKWLWHEYGPMYEERKADIESRWVNAADSHLKLILQKKLFDLQCLWRAEKVMLPGIEISYDFDFWARDIFNCPVLEPITENEIDLYVKYLFTLTEEIDVVDDIEIEWQNYNMIKTGYDLANADGYYPEWYEFYNSHTGKGVLMQLPNTRGEKEEFYRRLYINRNRELNKEKEEKQERDRDKRPYISVHNRRLMKIFLSSFEDRKTQRLYNAYINRPIELSNYDAFDSGRIQEAVDMLLSANEKISIAGNADWKEGLLNAAHAFECSKIAEAMPVAWEQYMVTIQSGIQFSSDNKYGSIRDLYYTSIVEGRVLNGEPRDVNF